jgi:hypothetical protein
MRTSLAGKLSALIGVLGAMVVMSHGDTVSGQGNFCGMQLNQAQVVFCETFDQPSPVTNRSGQMNGTLWGVSRLYGGSTDLTQWHDSTLDGCNGPQPASVNGATDLIVCNGQLRESSDDNHDVSVLAMYPKQPFDFANRTGTVSFDVSNDTTGNHGAWPEFWITDQPVPAPSAHLVPCDLCSIPRNSFGIRFAANKGTCGNGWRADSAIVTRNYVVEDRSTFEYNTTGMKITETGCASLSSGPNGGLNHVEIRVSQNQIDVYASDAGTTTPLRKINTITNANLTFTKGLIWIEDSHYNAQKAHDGDPSLPDQRVHTYAWDNVAFDGPPTYRDLAFDVLDHNLLVSPGLYKVGWDSTPSSPANLTTLPMTAANIASATGALLLFNFGKDTFPSTFNFTVNGHANSVASAVPTTGALKGMRSVAIPVPLNQLVPGSQNVLLSSDVAMSVANINVVLVAAASVPSLGFGPTAPTNLRIVP